MEPDIIHRFLESVGQKADVDLYLKLFRSQRKESFAIIVADAQILRAALDPLHFDLRILAGLGLYPVVLVGLLDARDADTQSQRIQEWLVEDEVAAKVIASGTDLPQPIKAEVEQTIQGNTIPIVSMGAAKEFDIDDRFKLLEELAAGLQTQKVIFLSASSGLERVGSPRISLVNLSTDYQHLIISGDLPRRHASLLRHVKHLLNHQTQRMNVAVVNPLQLLRELFTVNGAGTLIRKGSRIDRHAGLGRVDRARLATLLESAFDRVLAPSALDPEGILEREAEHVYLEENYRGAALLSSTPIAPYLGKFAVDRQSQGEGIGGEIWSMFCRDFPTVFWRTRVGNPIAPWYVKQCDGMVKTPEWLVFWRGLATDKIPAAVDYAIAQPRAMIPRSDIIG